MTIQNLMLNICLPTGLRCTNGMTLMQPVTFDIISQLFPYYASVDQVRLTGGMYLRKLPDITLACEVYMASQQSDMISPLMGFSGAFDYQEVAATPASQKFTQARMAYTRILAARNLIENVIAMIGNPAAHVLANFSIQRQKAGKRDGIEAKLDQLDKDLKMYEVTIRSNGQTMPGGHVRPAMAAKGVMDWGEATPSRTWAATGMGANMKSPDYGSPTGGRGKPVSYFYSPFYSPAYTNYRYGVYQGTTSISVTAAFGSSGNYWGQ